jgi:gas vesicle protein
MVNHNYEHENHAYEPEGSWAEMLTGLLAGLLIGSLAGATAMLFLAPQSGKETRAKMQQLGYELRAQTGEAMDDAVAQVRVKAGQITHDVRKQAEEPEQPGQAMLDGQKGH